MRGMFCLVLVLSMMGCTTTSQIGRAPLSVSSEKVAEMAQANNLVQLQMNVVAFVDAYAQGPVNKPVLVNSIKEFEKVFGALNKTPGADNRAYLQIAQFFQNGGQQAWINRIVPPNWIGTQEAATGIYAFTDFDILVLPGLATLKESEAQPARRAALELVTEKNSFLILDPPAGRSYEETLAWRNGAAELLEQKNAAIFYPRIKVADPASEGKARFLEPSGSLAGIIASHDTWISPGNTEIAGALDVEDVINNARNGELNLPPNGVSINPIRNFMGRGILVWEARTLNGNSNDYRYIQAKRTAQLIGKNLKLICQPFAFAPNTSATWIAVQSSVSVFLTNLWKVGAIQGAKPADAFEAQIGLGSTMTSQDILNGIMRLSVKAAITHPAEFLMFTLEQQVQAP